MTAQLLSQHKGGEEASRKCPNCQSKRIWKDGVRETNFGSIQRFVCRDCGVRFSQKSYKECLTMENRQLCALLKEAKKLDTATETNTVAGDIEDIEIKIAKYLGKLGLQGRKESTICLSRSCLKTLVNRGANLADPETVKEVIAKQTWSGNRKRNVINAYTQFLRYLGLAWEPPNYTIIRKLPFIPTEQEIDDLIAGSPNPLATLLQLLKETAMRRGEAIKIPWRDVDLERRIVTCNYPEKNSNARIFSDLSGKLLNMLSNLPRENGLLFGTTTPDMLKNQLCRTRKRLAFKLGNQHLMDIHFHTLRHWKATMLYHQTKDMLLVADFLGHKDLENTRLYIQLEKNLLRNLPNDQFITRVALNVEEACRMIEVGFEYITGEYTNGGKIFRKRK